MKRRLQRTNKDQYLLTIPKSLVEILKLKEKDEIEFILHKDGIMIRKRGEADES